jgi:hypothetical protein
MRKKRVHKEQKVKDKIFNKRRRQMVKMKEPAKQNNKNTTQYEFNLMERNLVV